MFCTICGFRRGLIRTLFSCMTIFLALFITSHVHHYVGKALVEFTSIDDTIQAQITKTLSVDPDEEKKVVRSDQIKFIDNLNLPDGIKKGLTENNNVDIYEAFGVNGFYDYISKYLTGIAMNAISFVITLLLTIVLSKLLLKVLDFLTELPILHGINRVGGLLLGAVQGLSVIWIFFIMITIFGSTAMGQSVYKEINDSTFLSLLYNNNYLLVVITSMSALLF